MRAVLFAVLACLTLAGCLGRGPAPLPPVGQAAVDQARQQCLSGGGRWAGSPGHGMLCFHTPPDAGQSCSRAFQCTAGCLAKSRTCAPVTPLIGCQDLLDDQGRVITQCVN